MKITYFRLSGYIKILNGMGIDTISIPFDKFKNRIILISGQNGTGKSTIIQALSPNPDSSDSFRTDVFIDSNGNRQIVEYPAEKEIHYEEIDELGNKNTYRIIIQSIVNESRTTRTTKAFISKNGEELNPNGNVSSFKELRDSLLGIDPVYLDLSSISAENRGLVDMIPNERRKYMSEYIGSLDTYNNIFKIISKKVSNLKSYMNTLNNKIYEIGNENELRLQLIQLEENLKSLNTERDKLIKDLSESETTIKILDPNGEMQSLYESISERLRTINSDLSKNKSKLDILYMNLKLEPENEDLGSELIKIEKSIEENNNSLNSNKSKISSLMALNESLSSRIEEDQNRLISLTSSTVQENIESAMQELLDKEKMYKSYLTNDDISILKKTTLDELIDLRDSLQRFIDGIKIIEEKYSDNIINIAINNNLDSNHFKEVIDIIRTQLREKESKSILLGKDIEDAQQKLEEYRNFSNTRPKNCKIDSCPYIVKYTSMDSIEEQESNIEEMIKTLTSISTDIESYKFQINDYEDAVEASNDISKELNILYSKSLIKKIESLAFLLDYKSITSKIKNRNRFPEFNIVDSLIEKCSIYNDLKSVSDAKKDIEADYKIYMSNKSLIDSLNESITKNNSEYESRSKEIITINNDCKFLEGLIIELSGRKDLLNKAIEVKTDYDNLLNEKGQLREEYNSVKDKIALVKSKVDATENIKVCINDIDKKIKPLSDTITQIKFNLTNIVSYQEEYKESSETYDKMLFIRNACSPGNGIGIQSEYIKRYMNDIIIDCNKMLSYMFGGMIQLDVPIINEKQFSMPFIGPNGLIVPDISAGSTAQKCMLGLVFSCVAMMKSSLKYNIPRLDEIDGGLDVNNRITFIQVLNQILDFMHSEQCVIISHNNEFDSYSTTKIICSPGGITIEQ